MGVTATLGDRRVFCGDNGMRHWPGPVDMCPLLGPVVWYHPQCRHVLGMLCGWLPASSRTLISPSIRSALCSYDYNASALLRLLGCLP